MRACRDVLAQCHHAQNWALMNIFKNMYRLLQISFLLRVSSSHDALMLHFCLYFALRLLSFTPHIGTTLLVLGYAQRVTQAGIFEKGLHRQMYACHALQISYKSIEHIVFTARHTFMFYLLNE